MYTLDIIGAESVRMVQKVTEKDRRYRRWKREKGDGEGEGEEEGEGEGGGEDQKVEVEVSDVTKVPDDANESLENGEETKEKSFLDTLKIEGEEKVEGEE